MQTFGTSYHNVYFRLNAGYKWGEGMERDKTEKFFDEITKLFLDDGWTVKEGRYSGSCPTVQNRNSYLYLHPMEATGPVEDSLREKVMTILHKGNTFTLRDIDVYEEVFDVSNNDYYDYLDANAFEIMDNLKLGFTTKRKDQYISCPGAVVEKVKEKYHISRLGNALIGRSSSDIEWTYVAKLFDEMVEHGDFVVAEKDGRKYYRTKKKGE